MIRQQLVYLAGPITGLSYGECTNWRKYVANHLSKEMYHCLSPMRGKAWLKDLQQIPSGGLTGVAADHAVYQRDCCDVDRCDIVFVNLYEAKIVSIGSVMEIARANTRHKFILTVMESGNVHEHLFTREASSLVVPDLYAGINYLNSVLNQSALSSE